VGAGIAARGAAADNCSVSRKPDGKMAPSTASQPVERQGLDSALRLFVARFVVEDKRGQIHKRLLTAERREETLGTLPRWLAGTTAPLAGQEQSPAGLRSRFGELVGVQLDAAGARRTTIAGALELGRGRASLFVDDRGWIALVTLTDGAPILCSRL
jgi:hypothetical protein